MSGGQQGQKQKLTKEQEQRRNEKYNEYGLRMRSIFSRPSVPVHGHKRRGATAVYRGVSQP